MEEEKKELPKKRWFGRGIYGSKDVPIRILDGLIAFLIVLTVALTAVFAINGGYVVSFDTDGRGSDRVPETPSWQLCGRPWNSGESRI